MASKYIGLVLAVTACVAVAPLSVSAAHQATSGKTGQAAQKGSPATTGRGGTQSTRSTGGFTGFPVTTNADYYNTNEAQNPEKKPVIIVATCNATSEGKELNGWVGANAPSNFQKMVASESGTARASVTFVVPWNYWYKVETKAMVGGAPTVPDMQCEATGWLVY